MMPHGFPACLATLLLGVTGGCFRHALPPTASLDPPVAELGTVAADLWVSQIEIEDSGFESRWNWTKKADVQTQLTANLVKFLRSGRYFRRVELLPGNPKPEDLILNLRFHRYLQTRVVWDHSDHSDLSATLRIARFDGKQSAEASSEFHLAQSYQLHWIDYSKPGPKMGGSVARTRLIELLLERVLPEFQPRP